MAAEEAKFGDPLATSSVMRWWHPIIASFVIYWVLRGLYAGMPLAKRLWRIPYASVKSSNPDAVRIGIIGASGIAKIAVIFAANKSNMTRVIAVAARDGDRARAYAEKYGIPRAYEGYESMLDDPEVEAVYLGLPSEFHLKWTLKAIEKGKHVLVEKPLTLNHEEAVMVRNAVNRYNDRKPTLTPQPNDQKEGGTPNKGTGGGGTLVVMEGYHWRFHPVARRVKRAVQDGRYMGRITAVRMKFNLLDPKALFKTPTGQKAKIKLLDRWCYAIDTVRFALGSEAKFKVESARFAGVGLKANLTAVFPGGFVEVPVTVEVNKAKLEVPSWDLSVDGSRHKVFVKNIGHPYVYHHISITEVKTNKEKTLQAYGKGETTFEHQLNAFAASIRGGKDAVEGVRGRLEDAKEGVAGDTEVWPTLANAEENMKLVDEMFRKGGQDILRSVQP